MAARRSARPSWLAAACACAAVASASPASAAEASAAASSPVPSARAPTISLRWPEGVVPARRLAEAGSSDHSFSYICEAKGTCKFPEATAKDYFDSDVDVSETDWELMDGGRARKVNRANGDLDTSKPHQYELLFDATDRAGNKAQQVSIFLKIADSVPPTITLCGNATVVVEASHPWTYCAAAANDNIDGNIAASMTTALFYNGHALERNGIQDAGYYGPHNLTLKTGQWVFKYRVQDTSGNVATAQETVVVYDSSPPMITVLGANPIEVECTDRYVDPGATSYDELDGHIDVRTYGGSRRSCNDIRQFTPDAKSGFYTVTSDNVNGGLPLDVWCDMETDGGGYTYYKIDNGKPTYRFDDPNSCTAMGLQLAVWRTEDHMHAMLHKYGTKFFATAPGIYGKSGTSGQSFSRYAMFSGEPQTSQWWKSIDGGSWFIRGTPFAQPNGDYTDGCWLGIFGFNPVRVNDDLCLYSTGPQYICSMNDKGGPGVLPTLMDSAVKVASAVDVGANTGPQDVAAVSDGKRFPPPEPGNYTIVYQATDKHGLDASPRARMVKVRDTIEPTMTITGFRLKMNPVWNNTHDYQFTDPGYNCTDTCDMSPQLTLSWDQDKPLQADVPGIYIRKYHCEDSSGNVATNTRSWVFVDAIGPMIALNGVADTYVEAEAGKVYQDEGARCTTASHYYIMVADNAPGTMDDFVKESGADLVVADEVGTYTVEYTCMDEDGESAPMVTRTVIVQDTTCVNLTMLAPEVQLIEAGFEYYPPTPDAIAWDALDGNLTAQIERRGDTVDVTKAFITRTSCAEIKRDCDTASGMECPTGDYWITAFPKNATGPEKHGIRIKVYCDMLSDGGGYTMYPVLNGKRISRYDDPSSCDELGLQVVVPRTETHFERMVQEFGRDYFRFVPGVYGNQAADLSAYAMKSGVEGSPVDGIWKAVDDGQWWMRDTKYPQPNGEYTPGCWLTMDGWDDDDFKFNDERLADGSCPVTVDTYLCSTNDKFGAGTGGRPDDVTLIDTPGVFGIGAEVGKFKISYHVIDANLNKECVAPSRIVVVKDTMPPELTLKYRNVVVQKTDVSMYHGIGGVGESAGVITSDGLNQAASVQVRGALSQQYSSGGYNAEHTNFVGVSSYLDRQGLGLGGSRRLLDEQALGGWAVPEAAAAWVGAGVALVALVAVVRRARAAEAEQPLV